MFSFLIFEINFLTESVNRRENMPALNVFCWYESEKEKLPQGVLFY